MGRGIESKETGDVISLLCSGEADETTGAPSCNQVRLAHFYKSTFSASFFGPTFQVFGDTDREKEQSVKRTLKQLSKQFRAYRKKQHAEENKALFALSAFAGVGLGGYVTVKLNTGAPIQIAAATCFLTWQLASSNSFLFPNFFSTKARMIKLSLNSQNGWNWSIHPKRVKDEKFQEFEFSVKSEVEGGTYY